VAGQRKPDEGAALKWVNAILDNLKMAFAASYKGFKYRKYARHYLGAFSYRINHRFDLHALVGSLLGTAATACSGTDDSRAGLRFVTNQLPTPLSQAKRSRRNRGCATT
jgi:hypothetical protein